MHNLTTDIFVTTAQLFSFKELFSTIDRPTIEFVLLIYDLLFIDVNNY
jgi:hypothetical protein